MCVFIKQLLIQTGTELPLMSQVLGPTRRAGSMSTGGVSCFKSYLYLLSGRRILATTYQSIIKLRRHMPRGMYSCPPYDAISRGSFKQVLKQTPFPYQVPSRRIHQLALATSQGALLVSSTLNRLIEMIQQAGLTSQQHATCPYRQSWHLQIMQVISLNSISQSSCLFDSHSSNFP